MPDYTEFLTPEQLAKEEEAWRGARLYARNGQVTSELVAKVFDSSEEPRILELGMGTGWVARQVFRLCGQAIEQYVGLDKHPAEIQMARDKVPDERFRTWQRDVRNLKPSEVASEFGGPMPNIVVAYAFVKHFTCGEWRHVVKSILDASSRFCAFEINVSATGGPIDDGPTDLFNNRIFPHSYAEGLALDILIEMSGYTAIERTIYSATPHGYETLFVCERRAQ